MEPRSRSHIGVGIRDQGLSEDSSIEAPKETGSSPCEWDSPLLKVVDETPTTRTFYFDIPDTDFSFRPGQYVVLTLPGVGDPLGASRTFSIASAPEDREALAITTRRGISPFKTELFGAKPGREFRLWGPFGTFVVEEGRPAILLGGGIGITPFRSMIRHAVLTGSRTPSMLFYSNRTV